MNRLFARPSALAPVVALVCHAAPLFAQTPVPTPAPTSPPEATPAAPAPTPIPAPTPAPATRPSPALTPAPPTTTAPPTTAAPPPTPASAPATTPAPPLSSSHPALDLDRNAERAEFSFPRLLGETVVGLGLGGGAGYLIFSEMCERDSDPDCFTGFLAATGATLAGSTLGVWATGSLLGGEGGFGWTFIGVLLPFTATAPFASEEPALAMNIALALGPLTGAIVFEIRSNVYANNLRAQRPAAFRLAPYISPLVGRRGETDGGLFGVRGTF